MGRSSTLVETPFPFADWRAVLGAPRSAFFGGHTADAVHDRTIAGALSPRCEALFTRPNTRVLLGQAANGALRFVAIPTQVYPGPTGEGELGLGPRPDRLERPCASCPRRGNVGIARTRPRGIHREFARNRGALAMVLLAATR